MLQTTLLQKLLSWFYPVKITQISSKIHPILELYLFRNDWQLATEDAIYSDGSRYRPLSLAFKKIEPILNNHSKILVLGAGLGSAISILNKKRIKAAITLVDNDQDIIILNKDWRWKNCKEYDFIHENAQHYVVHSSNQYNVVVIDIFNSKCVPGFVIEKDFLLNCRQRTFQSGKVILNYIQNDLEEWKKLGDNFSEIFPKHETFCFGINKILIATV